MTAGHRKWFGMVTLVYLLGCSAAIVSAAPEVCFKKTCFNVEIAFTEEQKSEGLQHREILPPESGMLFVFGGNSRHRFWMKDTLIPLDIIWLDYAQKVVYIEHNAQPCSGEPCPSFSPDANAMYVLEVNAGLAKEQKIKIGSAAAFKNVVVKVGLDPNE